MGSVIDCFLLEPSGFSQQSLRRFAWSTRSNAVMEHLHDASVVIETNVPLREEGGADSHPHDDPRWPKTCRCQYVFQDRDPWQFNENELYERKSTGERYLLAEAPPGAMWFAPWLEHNPKLTQKNPDGHVLIVVTPGGHWCLEAPSSNGPGWTRTGVPPLVTATPSILQTGYHGFLTNGQLIEV